MKFSKTLACIAATAVLASGSTYALCHNDVRDIMTRAGLFGDINSDGNVNAADATEILLYAAWRGAGNEGDLAYYERLTNAGTTETAETSETAGTDPETKETPLTIISMGNCDLEYMLDVYMYQYRDSNVVYRNIMDMEKDLSTSECYEAFINSGEDADICIVNPFSERDIIEDDHFSLPLSELGITEADYADAYPCTLSLGKNSAGVLKGAAYNVFPGFFAYRTDLAKEYLGVTSPEQMQEKVKDWTTFEATAAELKEASKGAATITATIFDMMDAYGTVSASPWVKDGTLQYDMPRDFADMTLRFIKNGYVDEKLYQYTDEWKDTIDQGKTLGFFSSAYMMNVDTTIREVQDDAQWSIVEGPQAFCDYGDYFCVLPSCDNREEAARFVKTFTTDEKMMEECYRSDAWLPNHRNVVEKLAQAIENPEEAYRFGVLDSVASDIKVSADITPYDQWLSENLITSVTSLYDYDPDTSISEMLGAYRDLSIDLYPGLKPGTIPE